MFELKAYQKKTLDSLKSFLESARLDGPAIAFETCLLQEGESTTGHKYRTIPGMEDTPYVCLRLPTGGGKTVLASHAISIAANAYLEQDFPVVLWLVPTNTIRRQTLEALNKPGHPYRMAIDDAYGGQVSIFDISEVEQVRPQDMTGRVCVIVGTIATLRVNDTDGRKIYAHNENFVPHFSRVPASLPGLEQIEAGPDQGKIKYSFANLLYLHRPLIIMDEAHNARTRLTFETLLRIRPACIIEFTATPDTRPGSGSNVLCRVSAAELKAEEMIKLPIMLTEHQNWQEAVRDTVLTRIRLAQLIEGESDFLRPIALIQAESRDREATVEVLKQHMIENEKIDPARIAVATGNQRELDGIDLFDPKCAIEYIITVEALKEGWDCSFAYVFCSVANIHSGKDVEQLLGRVLRMPYAKRRNHDELNRAYAHVSSPGFAQAAQQLRDRLVNMGFEEEEATAFVQPAQRELVTAGDTPLFNFPPAEPLILFVSERMDFSLLSPHEQEKIKFFEEKPGRFRVVVDGEVTAEIEEKLVHATPKDERTEIRKTIQAHRYFQKRKQSPAERGDEFSVPRLCLRFQGELELAEKELFLDARGWNLLDFPPELTEAEFSIRETARTFEVDVKGKRVVYGLVNGSHQMNLGNVPTSWTDLMLSRWLDKQVRQPDIRQEVLLEFLRRSIAYLMEKRTMDLPALARGKFLLAKSLLEKIKSYRQQAYENGYQETLFGPDAAVETSYRFAFRFPTDNYPANWYYRGAYGFRKHFYPVIGELESSGEEYECARLIASLPEVKHWVRNLSGQQHASFWLPTSTDLFYPDFVVELNDGRILVVEYKGEHLIDSKDTKEKRNLGALWEEKSQGKGLFLMAEKRDSQGRDLLKQLKDKIGI